MVDGQGGTTPPVYPVILEIELAASTEAQAKQLARKYAGWLMREDDVLAVAADSKDSYLAENAAERARPITERYLALEGELD